MTASLTLSAFGQTVASSGSSSSPYQFGATSGYRAEGDAGLTLVGCRFYDAQVGRFITRDTYLNQKPYAYCDGDPVNALDPTGHLSDEGDIAVLALGGGALVGLLGIHVALRIGGVTLGGVIIATGTAGLALTGGVIILGVIAIGGLAWGTYEGTTKILDALWPTPESG